MTNPRKERATELWRRALEGEAGVVDELVTLVYEELRQIAAHVLGGQLNGTLGPTALVNEAYLRLIQSKGDQELAPEHFMAMAATAMRHALIDHVRARKAEKRGNGVLHCSLDEGLLAEEPGGLDLLELDDALQRLEREHPRAGRIFVLRFFGGLAVADVAKSLEVSTSTIEKDWRFGRAFLMREFG